MRLKAIALIAVMTGGFASAASAMTVTKPAGLAAQSALQQVDYKDHKGKKSYHKRQQYRAGGRYNKAPGNWHRYGNRPGDWQRRGCITVGPIWWCP